ncbi:MAG: hypothetical protein PHU25_01100 [Deltaproteobacteria bacterium]|nr:hypothetical protein [Deltaproteobacteria bacterium]
MRGVLPGLCALLALATAAAPAFAADEDDATRIPVLGVEAGGGLQGPVMDAVAIGLGVPSLGGALLAALIVPASKEAAKTGDARARLAQGEEDFYAGRFEQSRSVLDGLVSDVERSALTFARDPGLREVVFRARIYLAQIAHRDGDNLEAERDLAGAVRLYPEMEPGPTDFPPWVCESAARLEREAAAFVGVLRIRIPAGCRAIVDGRDMGARGEISGLSPGPHAVQARCGNRIGPPGLVEVGETAQEFEPAALEHCAVMERDDGLRLVADDGASDAEIAGDAAILLRTSGRARSVVVVSRPHGMDVWLVDIGSRRIVRRAVAPSGDAEAVATAAGVLGRDIGEGAARARDAEASAWYRDGLAWGLVAGGVAALSAGFALGQVYGSPSRQEAWTWALFAAGGGLGATGLALFVVPGAWPANDVGASGGPVAIVAVGAVDF